jgi:hypothetical protein
MAFETYTNGEHLMRMAAADSGRGGSDGALGL